MAQLVERDEEQMVAQVAGAPASRTKLLRRAPVDLGEAAVGRLSRSVREREGREPVAHRESRPVDELTEAIRDDCRAVVQTGELANRGESVSSAGKLP